jgi:hypothetical protein
MSNYSQIPTVQPRKRRVWPWVLLGSSSEQANDTKLKTATGSGPFATATCTASIPGGN